MHAPDGRNVCKDLVIEDIPDRNPFRKLLSLADEHLVLRYIIIGTAALHFANSSALLEPSTLNVQSNPSNGGSQTQIIRTGTSLQAYKDALSAKQEALGLLANTIADTGRKDDEVILASMMLFVKFELLDCSMNDWRFHTQGAKQLMAYLSENRRPELSSLSELRDSLMSNCIV